MSLQITISNPNPSANTVKNSARRGITKGKNWFHTVRISLNTVFWLPQKTRYVRDACSRGSYYYFLFQYSLPRPLPDCVATISGSSMVRREQMLAFHLRNAISTIFQKNVFKSVPYPNISKTPRSSEMWTSLNNVVALDRQPILSESMLEKIHDRRTITKIQSATEGYKRNLSLHGSPWWTSYCVGSIHWFVCGMLV